MSDDDYDLDDEQTDTDELNDDDGKIDTELVADTDDDEEVSADELAAAASAHSSLAARNKIREAMQAEIEAFLAKGGKIQQVEDKLMGDPPKKPTSNYGSRRIQFKTLSAW